MQCDTSSLHSKHAEGLRGSSCDKIFKARAPRPVVSADSRSIAVNMGREQTLADAGVATPAGIGALDELAGESSLFPENCSDDDGGCVSQLPATVAECPRGFLERVLARTRSARSMDNSTPSSSSRTLPCSSEADSSPPSRTTGKDCVVAVDKPVDAGGLPPKSHTSAEGGRDDETRTQNGRASAGSLAQMQEKKPSASFPTPARRQAPPPPPSNKSFSAKFDPSDPYNIIRCAHDCFMLPQGA